MPTLIVTSNAKRETSEDEDQVLRRLSTESKWVQFLGLSPDHRNFTVRPEHVELVEPTDTLTSSVRS